MPDLAQTFAALGDDTRLTILERLLTEGPLPAGAFADVAEISAPAISRHLKVLRQAGLVDQQVDRQRRIYSARPEAIRVIGAWTMRHQDFWNASLTRLASALQEKD